MDYSTVFQLAQDKGYRFGFVVDGGFSDDNTINVSDYLWEYHNGKAIQRTYIELCLIQKWLRDEKNVSVTVIDDYVTQEYKVMVKSLYEMDSRTFFCDTFSTYEKALLEGINEALLLHKVN